MGWAFGLLCSSTRWWFQIFLFSSLPGEMINIFQMGWNHRLENPWFFAEVLGGRQLLRVWLRFRLLGQWGGHTGHQGVGFEGDKNGAKIWYMCFLLVIWDDFLWFEMTSGYLKWSHHIFGGWSLMKNTLAVCLSLPKTQLVLQVDLIGLGEFFEILGWTFRYCNKPAGWQERPVVAAAAPRKMARWAEASSSEDEGKEGPWGREGYGCLMMLFCWMENRMKQDMFFRWKSKNISYKTCWVQVFFGDFDDHLDGYTLSKHLHTCKGVGFIRHLCARCCTASSGPFAYGQEEWTDAWADQGHEESHVPWRQPWQNSKIAFNVREKLLSWNPTCGKMTWSGVSLEPGEFESACRVGTGCRRTEEDWWLCQYHHRLRGIAQDVREASKPGRRAPRRWR